MLTVACRARIAPFEALGIYAEALRREANHQTITHMEVGEPGLRAPEPVIERVIEVLRADPLRYAGSGGLDALRTCLQAHYRRFYGMEPPPRPGQFQVTTGSSCGFILAFLACFDPGSRVGLFSPAYPAYPNILSALGLVPQRIPTLAEDGFRPCLAALERLEGEAARLDGLVLSSPCNPTGAVIDPQELERILAFCRAHAIRVISDEVYHGIEFQAPSATAIALDPEVVVINSFSKYFGLTGWRVGWMVLPESLVEPVNALAQSLFVAAPTLSQHAACAVLEGDDAPFRARVEGWRVNRDLLVAQLPGLGIEPIIEPGGGFYLYARIDRLSNDSRQFCQHLLEVGLAVTPGYDFDPEDGARSVRISFCAGQEKIEHFLEILQRDGARLPAS